MRTEMLIIDPNNDFCCPKGYKYKDFIHSGSLYVPNAENDMTNVANLIKRKKRNIYDIHVTLDTHHKIDVNHSIFWMDEYGKHPGFYTKILLEDLDNGKFMPSPFVKNLENDPDHSENKNRTYKYVKALRDNKRYDLTIWPYHCLIGTPGHCVFPPLAEALDEWESDYAMVDYVTKGSNFWTEHYSAVQADVPDPNDPSTQLNTKLITTLENADLILVCGEALNFCLKYSVEDIAKEFGKDNVKKMVLLKDGTSPVPLPGYEQVVDDFLNRMEKDLGMQTAYTTDF